MIVVWIFIVGVLLLLLVIYKKRANRINHFSTNGMEVNMSSKGKIVGTYHTTINGQNLSIPINTSIQQIQARTQNANDFENETGSKYGKQSIIDLGNGKVRVKWSYLNNRFMKGAVMDDDLFWAYDGVSKYIDIPKTELERMEEKRKQYLKRERSIQRTASLNNKGIEFEKYGRIEEAIKIYERNISYDDCNATHSYDRLLVLYRKQKNYQNELRVCQCAIKTFKSIQKYRDRLSKIKELISKNQ